MQGSSPPNCEEIGRPVQRSESSDKAQFEALIDNKRSTPRKSSRIISR